MLNPALLSATGTKTQGPEPVSSRPADMPFQARLPVGPGAAPPDRGCGVTFCQPMENNAGRPGFCPHRQSFADGASLKTPDQMKGNLHLAPLSSLCYP